MTRQTGREEEDWRFVLPSSFVGVTARGTYDVQRIEGFRFRDFDEPKGAQE